MRAVLIPRLFFARSRSVFVAALLSRAIISAQETNAEYEERKALEAAGLPPPSRNPLPVAPSTGAPVAWGHLVTFFPPTPPMYGGVLAEPPARSVTFNGRSLDAPDGLADFVGETFYPALSSRLFEAGGKPSHKLQARLAAYHASRGALLDELVSELLNTQAVAKAGRIQALQKLARRQAAGLAKLEQEAEELRQELVKGGFFSARADWNLYRSWRLGASGTAAPFMKAEAEFQVARGTAFFQEGLSVEQRGLLRELAIELARSARAASGQRTLPDDDPAAMFFSPETARFRVPARVSPELIAQIGRFNGEKAALKRELLAALIANDELPPEKRALRFAELAVEQAPRIGVLQGQAEEIRQALDALPDPPAPWLPPISPELRARLEDYKRDRAALLARYASALLQAAPNHRRQRREREPEAERQAAENFETENAEEIAALRVRYETIRDNLTEIARGLTDPRNNRPLTADSLLDAYRVAMQRFDTIGREEAMYQYYKIAMLQPGLSPAQRRLLFRAAHANLAQALPMGEVIMAASSRPMPQS